VCVVFFLSVLSLRELKWISGSSIRYRPHNDEPRPNALIDANRNGIPNEKTDVIPPDIMIGIGRVAAYAPPHTGRPFEEQTFNGNKLSTIWTEEIESLNPVNEFWAVIIPPI
jgi:hypothetical protein